MSDRHPGRLDARQLPVRGSGRRGRRRRLGAHPELGKEVRPEHEQLASYREAMSGGWKEGMGTLLLMAANARYFGDSGSRPCVDVGDAEAAAGVAIDFYARVFQEQIGSHHSRSHRHSVRDAW